MQEQISFLCRNVPSKEWSGVLFFTTTGTFGQEDFAVTGEELFLMDIGNATYTEYDFTDPRFVKFMMANPAIMSMTRGHIHSHNTMGVFFSGTDDSELVENSKFYNFYLSLIVNNKNEMCAKIAFVGATATTTSTVISHKDQNGNNVIKELIETTEEEKVFAYECVIECPGVEEEFEERFLQVQEAKREAEKYVRTEPLYGYINPYAGHNGKAAYKQAGLYDSTEESDSASVEEKGFKVNDRRAGFDWGEDTWKDNKKGPDLEKWVDDREDDKKNKIGSVQVMSYLSRLIAQDKSTQLYLSAILKRLDTKYYPEGNEPTPEAADYYGSVSNGALDFYKEVFTQDPMCEQFDEVMESCQALLENFETGYPEIVAGLKTSLNLTVKD